MSFFARPVVLWRAISRMVSMDSCLAVSMKEQVLTTRISASSGWAVRRAPARSSKPIITSESTRFLGQPREMKPTVGGAGGEFLVTFLIVLRWKERWIFPEIPRLGFALCLPLRIGYVVDLRTDCLVPVERHPTHPARIPASGFRLFWPL